MPSRARGNRALTDGNVSSVQWAGSEGTWAGGGGPAGGAIGGGDRGEIGGPSRLQGGAHGSCGTFDALFNGGRPRLCGPSSILLGLPARGWVLLGQDRDGTWICRGFAGRAGIGRQRARLGAGRGAGRARVWARVGRGWGCQVGCSGGELKIWQGISWCSGCGVPIDETFGTPAA